MVWAYSIISVLAVSCVSMVGVLTLSFTLEKIRNALFLLVSFAAGALLGDAFLHLLPEVIEGAGGLEITHSLYILGGIALFFVVEKIIHWRHCHEPADEKSHIHPFAITNLVGDAVHNFIDGVVIGASYLVSIPLGLATTLAVIFHEIPQEISDFGVLIHGGFTKTQALVVNFISALTAVFGAIIALSLGAFADGLIVPMLSVTVGVFVYIAGADLIPELHKELKVRKSIAQFLAFLAGIGVMMLLLMLE